MASAQSEDRWTTWSGLGGAIVSWCVGRVHPRSSKRPPSAFKTNDVRRRARAGTDAQSSATVSSSSAQFGHSYSSACPHVLAVFGSTAESEEINAKSFASAKLIRILWLWIFGFCVVCAVGGWEKTLSDWLVVQPTVWGAGN